MSWARELLARQRIDVSLRTLTVAGRSFPLSRHSRIEAEAQSPRMAVNAVLVAISVVGMPLLMFLDQGTQADRSWRLAIPAMCFFAACLRIFAVSPTYCVVLRSPGLRDEVIFRSTDHQLVISLVAALQSAVEESAASGPVLELI